MLVLDMVILFPHLKTKRVITGFDKSRTTSRGLNKMVYCWEGFKKMFTKTFKVNNLVHRIQSYKVSEKDIGTVRNISNLAKMYRTKMLVSISILLEKTLSFIPQTTGKNH